jgi:hypothetical protein
VAAKIAAGIRNVPDESIDELVRWFIPRSKKVGGRMRWFGRNVQLSSKQQRRRGTRTSTSVLIVGTPAACWSIKSYGRRGDYDVTPRRALAISWISNVAFARVHITNPTKGDRRWDRLVEEANDRLPDVVADLIDRGVRI